MLVYESDTDVSWDLFCAAWLVRRRVCSVLSLHVVWACLACSLQCFRGWNRQKSRDRKGGGKFNIIIFLIFILWPAGPSREEDIGRQVTLGPATFGGTRRRLDIWSTQECAILNGKIQTFSTQGGREMFSWAVLFLSTGLVAVQQNDGCNFTNPRSFLLY